MTQTVPIPNGLPTDRDAGPFDPPTGFTRLRESRPVCPLVFPDGHEGWLVTGYDEVRQVLADTRFSSRLDLDIIHVPYPTPGMPEQTEPSPQMPGLFISMDPPDHTRLRRRLTGAFTVKRMKQLEEHINDIAERHLDQMARLTPPVDLVKEFALPVPSLVICELLGVPYEDRETFQHNAARFMVKDIELEEKIAVVGALTGYLAELVTRKRAEPGEDILSDLARQDDLSIEELTGIAFLLLLAGHETTANMLGLGTFALLENPRRWPICVRTRSWCRAPSRNSCGTCPSPTSSTVTPPRTSKSAAKRSPRGRPSSSRCCPPTATPAASTNRTSWTCTATPAGTWPSATASTSASASSWPGWRCAPGSPGCCAASRTSGSPSRRTRCGCGPT